MPFVRYIFISTALLITLIYFFSAAYLYIFQNEFLYQPTEAAKHDFSTLEFLHENVSVNSIVLNKGNKDAIIYFGGSGEPMREIAPEFRSAFKQHTVYLVNYRGYGASIGTPSEQALFSDALFIFDSIQERNLHENITIIGYSLGTGVAVHVAAFRNFASLILVAPFDSMVSVARNMYPIYPINVMLRDKFNSLEKIKHVNEETLVILADQDETVPYELSKRIIDAFPKEQLTVVTLRNTDHNTLTENKSYFLNIQNFIHE